MNIPFSIDIDKERLKQLMEESRSPEFWAGLYDPYQVESGVERIFALTDNLAIIRDTLEFRKFAVTMALLREESRLLRKGPRPRILTLNLRTRHRRRLNLPRTCQYH